MKRIIVLVICLIMLVACSGKEPEIEITETSNITSIVTEGITLEDDMVEAPIVQDIILEEPTLIDENENEPEPTLTLRQITQNAGLLYLAEGFNIHVALPYYETNILQWESPYIAISEGYFMKFVPVMLPRWAMPPWSRLSCPKRGELLVLLFEEFEGFEDSGLFEHTTAWIFHDSHGGWIILDTSGEFFVPPIFANTEEDAEGFVGMSSFIDGFAIVFLDGGLRGMIDIYGNTVIPPIYNSLFQFNNGLATARRRDGEQERYFLVNQNGEEVAEFYFEPIYLGNGIVDAFWYGVLFNLLGEPIHPEYMLIDHIGTHRFIAEIHDQGARNFIILDILTGEKIPLPEVTSFWRQGNDLLGGFENVLRTNLQTEYGNRLGIITEWGLVSHDFMLDVNQIGCFSNGVAVMYNHSGEVGVISEAGELIVPFGRYTNILGFGDVLSAVSIGTQEENNVLWGFIDTTGREVISPMYSGLYIMQHPPYAISQSHYILREHRVFRNGTAVIQCPETLLWGIIDNTGREIVTPAFDSISHFIGDFALANIGGVGNTSFLSELQRISRVRGGTWYIIDRNGSIVASFDYGRMYHIGENLFNFSYEPQYQIMDYWYEHNWVEFYDYYPEMMFGGIEGNYGWQLLIIQ